MYPGWWWGCLAGAAIVMALTLPNLIMARVASVALFAFATGALTWHARHAGPPGDAVSRLVDIDGLPWDCTIEGIVRLQHLENDDPDDLQFTIDADAIEFAGKLRPVTGRVLALSGDPGWTVHAGERVRAKGRISARFGYRNFGVRSSEDYWAREKVYTRLIVDRAGLTRLAAAPWWSGRHWMSRLRKAEADTLQRCMPSGPLPFIKAVWLGYRASISKAEYQRYVRAGVAHILSVSGIHASILSVTVAFMLRLFVKDRRWWALLTMLAVLVFAVTTGIRPSALRAAIMITAVLAAHIVGREPDSASALGLSGLVLLAWNPDTLFDGSFQLSFLSLASLILFTPVIDSWWPRRNAFRWKSPWLPGQLWVPAVVQKPLAASLAVQILPLPVVESIFHVLPVAGFAVNLLVIPLSAAMLWLTFLTLLVSLVSIQAATLLGHAIVPLYAVTIGLIHWVASADWTWMRLTSPTPPALLAFWAAAGCGLTAAVSRRPAWFKPAALFGVAAIVGWRLYMPEPRVDFLSVRNGDSIVITSPGGRIMLVDGGDAKEEFSNGEDYVAPYLWANYVNRLDYVVATHSDRDHLGGLFYILENFRVGEVWISDCTGHTPLETQFEALCAQKGVPVRRVKAGDTARLDAIQVRVLHPPPRWENARGTNDTSVVLLVEHGGARVLLTGDIESAAEELVARADCRADLMKAPHHGSGTSSSPALIKAAAARSCVVSCAGNASERVDPEVIARYRTSGCPVWRTDILGGIRVHLDTVPLKIESARKPPQARKQ